MVKSVVTAKVDEGGEAREDLLKKLVELHKELLEQVSSLKGMLLELRMLLSNIDSPFSKITQQRMMLDAVSEKESEKTTRYSGEGLVRTQDRDREAERVQQQLAEVNEVEGTKAMGFHRDLLVPFLVLMLLMSTRDSVHVESWRVGLRSFIRSFVLPSLLHDLKPRDLDLVITITVLLLLMSSIRG